MAEQQESPAQDTLASKSSLSRRRLLAAGAAGAAALAGGTALESASSSFARGNENEEVGPSINGSLDEVRGDVLVIREPFVDLEWPAAFPTPDGVVDVRITDATTLYRNGPAKPSDFVAGDSLIAFVDWTGSDFEASTVEPVYVEVEATVASQSGERIETDQGTIWLTSETLLREGNSDSRPFGNRASDGGLAGIEAGSQLWASCRVDQAFEGDYVAACLEVR